MNYVWYLAPTHYDKALSNGISAKTLENRVREYGWDIERAMKEPLHRQKLKSILTDGIIETLKINNIALHTFKARVFVLGWNISKAITTPTKNNREAIQCAIDKQTIISKEQYAIAERNGINFMALRKRVYRGWSIEKSIITPIFTNKERASSGYFHKTIKSSVRV